MLRPDQNYTLIFQGHSEVAVFYNGILMQTALKCKFVSSYDNGSMLTF